MCMMCEEDQLYTAYMAALDRFKSQGRDVELATQDELLDSALNIMDEGMKAQQAEIEREYEQAMERAAARNNPAPAKPNPFYCEPTDE